MQTDPSKLHVMSLMTLWAACSAALVLPPSFAAFAIAFWTVLHTQGEIFQTSTNTH